MALPVIIFNSGTGSDTAASGAGPATALSGTAAATATSTTVTLSVDGPNLSGVATDGSAVLWVDSTSGRQFSKITAVDNTLKTVTVQSAYANTEGTRNWGIGGKRATWNNANSRKVFVDALGGWIIETESGQNITTTGVDLTASVSAGMITVRGSSGAVRVIDQSANSYTFDLATKNWCFRNLKFTNSNGTKTAAIPIRNDTAGNSFHVFDECIFGDATNTINTAFSSTGGTPFIEILNCEITKCTTSGLKSTLYYNVQSCWIHDNVSHGVNATTGIAAGAHIIQNSVISFNGSDGINITDGGLILRGCTIHGNTSDGVDLSSSASLVINESNNFTNNGNYGIRTTTAIDLFTYINRNNNYGSGSAANTSGNYLNLAAGTNDTAVDPAGGLSTATKDYAGTTGGSNFMVSTSLKALGYPIGGTKTIGAGVSSTYSYLDIGGAQRQEPAGGSSGMLFIPGSAGGMNE